MKKTILTIALVLAAALVVGQNYDTKGKLIVSKKITQDTSILIPVTMNQAWGVVFKWASSTSTLSTVTIKCSKDDGATWQTYPGISAFTVTGSAGDVAFEDPDGCINTSLKLYVDINASEVMTVTIEYVLLRKF